MHTTRFHVVLSAAITVLLAGALSATAQKVTKDIAYTTDASGTQAGDLYQPVGPGPFPVILYLHGGSWRSGNKDNFAKLAPDLAAQGYAGFAVNYDLHPHAWPLAFEETESAIRFLRAHAAEYHLDPDRIVVTGTSAGGQLAALAALTPKGADTRVVAAIELNGVYDLHGSYGVIKRYLGVSCGDQPPVCDAASPISQVHAGAPPFFMGHGTSDHVVPYAAAQAFTAALRQAGDTVVPFDANGGPHMYWEKKTFYADNLAAVLKFLSQVVPSGVAGSGPAE